MSVCTEITDSTADCLEQSDNRNPNMDTDDKNPTFIVTDPDSDIETDAVPNAPRARGTSIPEPRQPKDFVNGESSLNEDIPQKNTSFSESHTKSRKIPPGFFKSKVPSGGNSVEYHVVQSKNVHFGNSFFFGATFKQPMSSAETEEEVAPPEYEILLSSKKVVSDPHLDCVADNIGKHWKKLGRQLGMKEAALYRFECDYKDDHRERVYQLLLEWKQSTGGPNQAPLLARLSAALWYLKERDALDSLVELEKDPRLNT